MQKVGGNWVYCRSIIRVQKWWGPQVVKYSRVKKFVKLWMLRVPRNEDGEKVTEAQYEANVLKVGNKKAKKKKNANWMHFHQEVGANQLH